MASLRNDLSVLAGKEIFVPVCGHYHIILHYHYLLYIIIITLYQYINDYMILLKILVPVRGHAHGHMREVRHAHRRAHRHKWGMCKGMRTSMHDSHAHRHMNRPRQHRPGYMRIHL